MIVHFVDLGLWLNWQCLNLYKTQYHLTVEYTMNGPNTHGTGWYDTGSEAPFQLIPLRVL